MPNILTTSIDNNPTAAAPAVSWTIDLSGHSISNDQQRFGVPSLYSTSSVNEVHPQVEYQVPSFIQDEHREFLSFMREYYRFSEKAQGPLHLLRRLLDVQDIDATTSELLEYFYREYAPSFPRSTALSPAIIIKNIKDFYLAKGSEKSYKFLFRVFFGQDVDFYYPRVDILRFSDSKWVQDRSVKCIRLAGDPSKLTGNRIIGATSKATAFVERILLVQDGNISSYELFLNKSSIIGKFIPDEIIRDESGALALRVLPLISKVKILNKGKGYETGQEVLITGQGFNCKARITSVGLFGEVESVQIYRFGAGYEPGTTSVSFPDHPAVRDAALGEAVFDTTAKYPGYFLNSDGMFSSGKRIQDGFYYQQYSYVVKSSESKDKYESLIQRLVHPAGYLMFSEVNTESLIDAAINIPVSVDGDVSTEIEVISDLNTTVSDDAFSLMSEQSAGAYFPEDETIVELRNEDVTYDQNIYLGPIWQDWERWKIDYRPTSAFGDPNAGMVQEGYYSLYANTPLKAFANVTMSEIAFSSWLPIDFVPETDIYQEIE